MAEQTGVGKLITKLGGPGAVIGIGSSLLKGLGGLLQNRKANRLLRSLKDPGYKIPEEFQQNLAKAEQMSKVGLPSQEYNLASTNIQRGTQAGLRQLGRMSNPFAGIGSVSRGQSDAFAKLDAQNAAARRQNILQAMGARRELAGQKLSQQQYAQQRYMDAVNQANALKGAGLQNAFGGLSGIANVGMMGMSQSQPGTGNQPTRSNLGFPQIGGAAGSYNYSGTPSSAPLIPLP